MHSPREEVHMLFIVKVAKNTFLFSEDPASYNGKCCGYGAFINLV